MGVTGGAAPGAWAPSAAPQAEQLSALSGLLRPQLGHLRYYIFGHLPALLSTKQHIVNYQ